MPDVPTNNPEQFYQGAPLLLVPDVSATADFYRRILGFNVESTRRQVCAFSSGSRMSMCSTSRLSSGGLLSRWRLGHVRMACATFPFEIQTALRWYLDRTQTKDAGSWCHVQEDVRRAA